MLHLNPDDISSAIITNQIEIGDDIMAKKFILDINVILNSYRQVDLEMLGVNYHDWSERSLNYLCRLFNNLNKGDDYSTTLPTIQIGILDFTPFPENPSFYSKNLMMDTETANTMYELYSDREMRHQMENREDFIRRQKRDQRMLKNQADIIAEKESALAKQADEIALKDSVLAEQADEIAKLRAQIETLKKSL